MDLKYVPLYLLLCVYIYYRVKCKRYRGAVSVPTAVAVDAVPAGATYEHVGHESGVYYTM